MTDIYGPMHLLRLFGKQTRKILPKEYIVLSVFLFKERLKQMLEFAPLEDDQALENLIFYTNDILR